LEKKHLGSKREECKTWGKKHIFLKNIKEMRFLLKPSYFHGSYNFKYQTKLKILRPKASNPDWENV
jgi:hypothetical protein